MIKICKFVSTPKGGVETKKIVLADAVPTPEGGGNEKDHIREP